MPSKLRPLYEMLSDFSTKTHEHMAEDLQRRLDKGKDNLANWFAEALNDSRSFNAIKVEPWGRIVAIRGEQLIRWLIC